MSIYGSTSFFKLVYFKSYLVWPNIMAIFAINNWYNYNNFYRYPPVKFIASAFMYPPTSIDFIGVDLQFYSHE